MESEKLGNDHKKAMLCRMAPPMINSKGVSCTICGLEKTVIMCKPNNKPFPQLPDMAGKNHPKTVGLSVALPVTLRPDLNRLRRRIDDTLGDKVVRLQS